MFICWYPTSKYMITLFYGISLQLEHLAFYLIELCLVEYEALNFKPSLLCASAIYAARCTLQMTPPWTPLLGKHTHYEESSVRYSPLFRNYGVLCVPNKILSCKVDLLDPLSVEKEQPGNIYFFIFQLLWSCDQEKKSSVKFLFCCSVGCRQLLVMPF